MLATQPGIRLHVGRPGAGKTYLMRQEIFAAARAFPVVVLDATGEWTRAPGNRVPREVAGVTRVTSSVTDALAAIDGGARIGVASLQASDDELRAHAETLAKWAMTRPGQKGVAVAEAHRAFPVTGLKEHASRLVTAWRHAQVAVWADTQRLAQIARAFDTAGVVRIFSATPADLARVREMGGDALVAAVRECGKRNAPKERGGRGEPGWHVEVFDGGGLDDVFEPTRRTAVHGELVRRP